MIEYIELRKKCLEQYKVMKAKHPMAILIFRNGDFYEVYYDDARACSEILNLTLVESECFGKKKKLPIVGFPHHALDTYLPKIVRAGHQVAICEQLEEPKR